MHILQHPEKLITEGDYYDAILALKPLLTSDRKSEAQEEALWLAHTLTLKWDASDHRRRGVGCIDVEF